MHRLVRGTLILMGLAFALPAAGQSSEEIQKERAEAIWLYSSHQYATAAQKFSFLCERSSDARDCWHAALTVARTPDGIDQGFFEFQAKACELDREYCSDALIWHATALFREDCMGDGRVSSCMPMAVLASKGYGTAEDYEIGSRAVSLECDTGSRGQIVAGQSCVNQANLWKANTQRRQTLGDDVYFGVIESTLTKGCKRHRYALSCIDAAGIVLERLDSVRGQPGLFEAKAAKVRELLDAAAEFLPFLPISEADSARANLPRLNQLLEDKLAGRK